MDATHHDPARPAPRLSGGNGAPRGAHPGEAPVAAPEGLSARLLRAALRTPAYREILRLHVAELRVGAGPDLVRAALREDPELWMSLASASPRLVDGIVQSLVGLGRELGAMPPLLVDAYLARLVAEIDREGLRELPAVFAPLLARALPGALVLAFEAAAGVSAALADLDPEERGAALGVLLGRMDPARLAEALNSTAGLVLAVRRDHPALFSAAAGLDWAALLAALDVGKARQAVVALSGAGRAGAERLLGEALADPVTIANLVGLLPALLNDGVGLASFALRNLDLPEEVLASAVFNVLRALDVEEVGRMLGRAAATVLTLHRGSATLGREEPAFLAVFTELADRLLDQLDVGVVARAAVALGEDGDVVARVLARRLVTDPEVLLPAVDALLALCDGGVQTALAVIRELEHLDPETRARLGAALGRMDGRALGELCNHGLALAEALFAEGGAAAAPVTAGLRETLDEERAVRLLHRVVVPLAWRVVGEAWRRYRAEPELLGGRVSALLGAFNRAVEVEPEAAEGFLGRALRAVDREELSRAARNAARLARRALLPGGGGPGPFLRRLRGLAQRG